MILRKSIKLLEEAKKNAKKIIEEAKKEAEKIKDVRGIMKRVQEFINQQEKKLQQEAKELLEKYLETARRIRESSLIRYEDIINEILREVIGLE